MDALSLPAVRDAMIRKLPQGDPANMKGADLGSGPVPLGVMLHESAGIGSQSALEYAQGHRNYLKNVFGNQPNNDHPVWGKFARLIGVDLAEMRPRIEQLDLKYMFARRHADKLDAVTALTVVESCTSNPTDFHTALLNIMDAVKEGGVIAMTFMAGSKEWTDGEGHHYPAAGVSHEQIKLTLKLFDSLAESELIAEEADAEYEHSPHQGMTWAVWNKPHAYNRATLARALEKLRNSQAWRDAAWTPASQTSDDYDRTPTWVERTKIPTTLPDSFVRMPISGTGPFVRRCDRGAMLDRIKVP